MEITLNNYQKLLTQVQKTIQETEKNIVESVNRQKVLMSWQIGKIIEQHLLENKRAQYGKKLLTVLAKDTGIKERALYQMRSFYKTYPTLPAKEQDLSWSHYRNLASVKSKEMRKYLENLAIENELPSNQLQKEISKSKPRAQKKLSEKKLNFQRGRIFTYNLVTQESGVPLIDCGFNIFTEIKTKLPDGLIESVKKTGGFSLKKSSANKKQLHTYKARLEKVIDGDTILVTLDLGFKIYHKEILRLAKIAAAETNEVGGLKANVDLKKILKDAPFLIIKTNKTDIYGRYIADVFFDAAKKEKNPQKVADSGTYLNQLLLDLGLVELF